MASVLEENRIRPLIVLVHGGASSGRSFEQVISYLDKKAFECISPDLPGHGTVAHEGAFTFEAANQNIAQIIRDKQAVSAKNARRTLLVGISLGGQAVLSALRSMNSTEPDLVTAAIVSGVSIHPPDSAAPWEMPHMPSDQDTVDKMMEDVRIAGMENMADLQARSFAFTFEATKLPPVLVVVGEHDTAMSKRDFSELVKKLQLGNEKSKGLCLDGAWHNHNIDVPERFAKLISEWAAEIL